MGVAALGVLCGARRPVADGLEPAHSDVTMLATTSVELDAEQAETLTRLVDALDDLDDVQDVFTNAEYPSEEVA